MITIPSYKVELLHASGIFRDTVTVYRAAVAYCVDCFADNWDVLSEIVGVKARFNYAERLIHSTKHNIAPYDFDSRFYKLPSYLRRAAISDALGAVSGYNSNHANWINAGCKGKEPRLGAARFCMPCFYHKEMYRRSGDRYEAELKLLVRGDWVWVPLRIKKTDADYLDKRFPDVAPSAPTLEKHHGKYYLRFAYREQVELSNTRVSDQRVCAVDLGINTDAVCSIMDARGTILDRKFIDFPSDKDHVVHVLNRVKRFQREHGPKDAGSLWSYAKRLNTEHARKIARAITDYASAHRVDVIVFEHLDMTGKKKGSKNNGLRCGAKTASRTSRHLQRIGAACTFRAFARGEPASLLSTAAACSRETTATMRSPYSATESSITAT